MGESAKVDVDEENNYYFSCDERSRVGSRITSFAFDDNESYFELSISGLQRTQDTDFVFQQAAVTPLRPTLAEIFVSEEAPAAEDLSVEGKIAPPEKSADAGERIDNDVQGPGTLPAGGEIEHGHRRPVFDEERRKIVVATRKSNWLLSAALRNEYIRNIFQTPVQRFRMAFKSEAKPKGEEQEKEPRTKSSAPAQATTARSSSPVFRKLWAPICDWFTFNKPRRGGKPPKPKMVEISGQGSMIGMLKDITAGKTSAKGRSRSSGREPNEGISKSAPTSPRHRSGFFSGEPPLGERNMERDASIGSAILHCKLSHLAKEI